MLLRLKALQFGFKYVISIPTQVSIDTHLINLKYFFSLVVYSQNKEHHEKVNYLLKISHCEIPKTIPLTEKTKEVTEPPGSVKALT